MNETVVRHRPVGDSVVAGVATGAAPHPLDAVLRPASIAIIGASPDPTKRGHRAVQALVSSGYRGRIVPVHPAGGELCGLRVARNPADAEGAPDLVLVCTPASTVPAVLAEWGEAGARGAVVLASGFGESGEAGAHIEAEVVAVARRTGIRVVGPNTSGVLNVPIGLNLIGLEGVTAGPLAVLVQSGNMALALVTEAARTGTGFSFVIGVGNESDIGFHEYLDFLAADPGTSGILVHAEGFRDGRSFLAAAARASRIKPVIVLKGGRTGLGGTAARSHTGAVAGSYDVFRSGVRQAGAMEVLRSDELLPVLTTLVQQPPVRSASGIVVLSDGGGQATIAADDLHARNIQLAELSVATGKDLRALLGPAAAVGNPVDLAGAADRDPLVFARALEIIARDPATAGVLVVGLFGGYAIRFAASLLEREIEAAQELSRIARAAGVPLVLHTLYAGTRSEPIRILQREGVPVIESLEIACRCAAAAVERGRAVAHVRSPATDWPAGDHAVPSGSPGSAASAGTDRHAGDLHSPHPEPDAFT
ncbi:MAG: CoA-binding protein, partial [Gemmatimonadetes bacterium]|nr:CoA-binding protein [Gemmatimonadota bacterium]